MGLKRQRGRHGMNGCMVWMVLKLSVHIEWNIVAETNTNRSRITVKLLRFKDKTEIFQNASKLKGQNIFIYIYKQNIYLQTMILVRQSWS